MSGGILGLAGDLMSVALLCFLFSLGLQLYCAFKRRTRLVTTLPSTAPPPPPQHVSTCNQLYVLRIQRSAGCPVLSTVAQPLSPTKLPPCGHVSSLSRTLSSQASAAADLAKLMLPHLDSKERDMESSVTPPRLLFTIKEEEKDGVVLEQPEVAATCERSSPTWQRSSTSAAGGLVSQMSSASSDGGGVSMWSLASSPAVSYLSASSSPFSMTTSTSPPRSSFWASNPGAHPKCNVSSASL